MISGNPSSPLYKGILDWLAKMHGKGKESARIEVPVAEEYDQVVQQRPTYSLHGIILQRTQIYTRDLCAKCACDTSDLHSLSFDQALRDVSCQVDLRSNGDICYGLSRQIPQTETNAQTLAGVQNRT